MGAVAVVCCKRSLQHCASTHWYPPQSSSSLGCWDISSPISGRSASFYLSLPSLEMSELASASESSRSPDSLHLGAWGKLPELPKALGGLPCPSMAVMPDRSSLMSAVGALRSPLQLHLELRLGSVLLSASQREPCWWGECRDVALVLPRAFSTHCRHSGSQLLV